MSPTWWGRFAGASAAMYSNAFLHMLYPEQFEYMISTAHRLKLVRAFQRAPGVAGAGDADQQIGRIRALADDGARDSVDLYGGPLMRIWKESAPRRWQETVEWAACLQDTLDLYEQERAYKLRIAAKLRVAREGLLAGESEWLERLRAACTDSENNLVSWRVLDRFLGWCDGHERQAVDLVGGLWHATAVSAAIRDFLAALPQEALAGAGTRLSMASFLLLAVDATRTPFFKPTVYGQFKKLLGLPTGPEAVEIDPEGMYRPEELGAWLGVDGKRVRQYLRDTYSRGEDEHGKDWYLSPEQAQAVLDRFGEESDPHAAEATYAEWTELLEELRLRMIGAGTPLRDLLDAQGLAWWLTQGPAPEQWDAAERAAFESFRDGSPVAVEVEAVDDATVTVEPDAAALAIPTADAALADRLDSDTKLVAACARLARGEASTDLLRTPRYGQDFHRSTARRAISPRMEAPTGLCSSTLPTHTRTSSRATGRARTVTAPSSSTSREAH